MQNLNFTINQQGFELFCSNTLSLYTNSSLKEWYSFDVIKQNRNIICPHETGKYYLSEVGKESRPWFIIICGATIKCTRVTFSYIISLLFQSLYKSMLTFNRNLVRMHNTSNKNNQVIIGIRKEHSGYKNNTLAILVIVHYQISFIQKKTNYLMISVLYIIT